MEDLFLTIFNMSITASYVILAVMLVRLLFLRFPNCKPEEMKECLKLLGMAE